MTPLPAPLRSSDLTQVCSLEPDPAMFRQAPAPFLKMIVVHELAHLKEREHGKSFCALCTHMEPAYHALEFDVRLWLTLLELDSVRQGTR